MQLLLDSVKAQKTRRISQIHKNSRTITCLLFKTGHYGKFQSTKAVSVRPFVRKLFKFAASFVVVGRFAVSRFAELWTIRVEASTAIDHAKFFPFYFT